MDVSWQGSIQIHVPVEQAYRYLADATAFWRLGDTNNAMLPEALGARDLVGIPAAGR